MLCVRATGTSQERPKTHLDRNMGAAGSLMPPPGGISIDRDELRRRYSRQLHLPVDASDLRAPVGATEDQLREARERALAEALFLRDELFKLSQPAPSSSATPVQLESMVAVPSDGRHESAALDRRGIEDICSGLSDSEDLRECIAFVAHIRQLLQRETAMVQRRARLLSNEGRLLISAMLTSDSDSESDDGLEGLP